MTISVAQYVEVGTEFTPAERLDAARRLIESVDGETGDDARHGHASTLLPSWQQVVAQRAREILDGRATLVDGRESFARARSHLRARES